LGINGIRTNYKIASFFAEFGKEPPLGERQRAILNGVITPVDVDVQPVPLTPGQRSRPAPPINQIFGAASRKGETIRRATVTQVNFALTFTNTPDAGTQERYRGITEQLYTVPPAIAGSTDDDFLNAAGKGGAICIDGFLNIDDEALYHVNNFKLPGNSLNVQRYWTGGRPFSNGTVVLVSSIGSSTSVFDVAIEDTNPLRRLADVPLLNGAVNIGDKTTLAARADSSTPRVLKRPGSSLVIPGVFLNPGGNSSLPVEVVSITNPGTSGALLTIQKLVDRGDIDQAADLTTEVVPVGNAEFVLVGDQGVFVSAAVLNTTPTTPGDGSEEVGKFFLGNRQNFVKFT
jgi:hypothetical protein